MIGSRTRAALAKLRTAGADRSVTLDAREAVLLSLLIEELADGAGVSLLIEELADGAGGYSIYREAIAGMCGGEATHAAQRVAEMRADEREEYAWERYQESPHDS